MKLALWQTQGFPADPAANLAALERAARAASAAGAALLLCPECWLCGYNIGDAVASLAEAADGDSARHIASIAREQRIAIAYGYAECAPARAGIFNSVQVIGPEGTVLGRYRKTHLFGTAERAAYIPGSCFAAPFEFGGFRIEAVRSLMLAGADVVLVPTALTEEYGTVPGLLVPARAVENQVYVAYCNHAGIENGMRFLGRSCLVAPDGQPVVAAGDGDALIVGEISASAQFEIARIYPYRADRRPELYGAVQGRQLA